jgi:hypothetical protein
MIVPLKEAEQFGDLYFRKFDKKLQLREVILGEKCKNYLNCIRQIAGKKVKVFGARLADKYFHIVPDESTY